MTSNLLANRRASHCTGMSFSRHGFTAYSGTRRHIAPDSALHNTRGGLAALPNVNSAGIATVMLAKNSVGGYYKNFVIIPIF